MYKDERYNRQHVMPEWGPERQLLVSKARVAVIGAGGVKSTLLMSLAAAGVGFLRIIEFDRVELSNLNRQILYQTSDIGHKKVTRCTSTLHDLNPEIVIEGVDAKVDERNIARLCDDVDFVVEGGDSPRGRNLVNEYCLSARKPFTHASAQFNYGYVFTVIPAEKTACFACFFPADHTRSIHTGPVPVSVLSTSVAGSLGATEVLKWFTGHRDSLYVNKRLCFSSLLLSGEFTIERQPRRPTCPVCSHHYATFDNL